MTLSAQPVTPKYITLTGDPTHNLISGGTLAAPIAVTAVGLYGAQIALRGSATSGVLTGGSFGVIAANPSGALELKGLHGMARVPTGIDVGAAAVRGLYIETEVLGTGKVGSFWEGARIELYGESGITLSSDVYGIYVASYLEKQPAGSYALMRLEHNPGTTKINAAIIVASAGGADSFINVGSTATDGWDAVGDKTGLAKAGFLKVKLWGMPGGGDRYIQLYGP
jgi:hypothetical protein